MAADQTLVQIRERSYLDVLDLALLVVRRHPRPIVAAAVTGALPFLALNQVILADPEVPRWVWPVLLFAEEPWATAPLTIILGGLMFGRAPGIGEIFRKLLRALPALFVVHVLIRGLLTVTFILLPVIPAQLGFASEVILLERSGPVRTFRRCAALSRDMAGDYFIQWVGRVVIGLIFACCFWAGTGAVVSALFSSELTWERPALGDLSGLRFQVGVWIAITFFAVARFFLYIDQRIRSEGWELRLLLQSVGRDLEQGRG